MIDIKNKIITAILIVIVTTSMLASSGSGAEGDTVKVPTITVNINPVKSPTNISTQIISGSGMGSGCKGSGGITDLRVTINGLAANIDASTNTFSRSISLLEGQNTITVIAQLGTLCSITKTTSIILDTTPPPITPTITLDINPVKSPTNISTQIISGSGMGSGCKGSGGITDLRVTVNGLAANIDASTNTFSRSISLSEGNNTITVIAQLGTLCSITKTTSIILDTPPPIPDPFVGGLVAEYHFDNDATDSSGNGNNGTINGAILVQGISGQALSFDGVDDMVVVPHSPSLSIEKYTMEAWIKRYQNREFGYPEFILIKRYEPSWMDNYGLYVNQNGTAGAGSYSPDIWSWFGVESVKPISVSDWYHIAATYDRNTLKIYINGVLDNSVNTQYTPYQNNYQLVIGRGCMGDPCMFRPYTPSFNGIIDEIRIYNRALSATEVMSEYNRINHKNLN